MLVALKDSEQCLAFSKSDHRRCRLRRLYGQKICTAHKNYYTNWFVLHPPWYRETWLSEREKKESIFQLKNGYVTVPEAHVRGLQGSFTEYYEFLVRYANIPVEWNIQCLNTCLALDLEDEQQPVSHLPLFLNTPRDCLFVFQQLLFLWIQRLVTHRQTTGDWLPYVTAFEKLRRLFTACDGWQQMLFSEDMKKVIQTRARILHVTGSILAEVDTLYIRPLQNDFLVMFKNEFKPLVRRRLAPFHEELMIVMWSTERVAAMLEAGIEPWDI
jgi:hypothetical protein